MALKLILLFEMIYIVVGRGADFRMDDIPERIVERYDRQIRLFGFETQKKIIGTRLAIFQGEWKPPLDLHPDIPHSVISGELLKNALLLGFGCVVINQSVLDSFSSVVPKRVEDINENVEVIVTESPAMNIPESSTNLYDVSVFVDSPLVYTLKNSFSACSDCCSFRPSFEAHCCGELAESDYILNHNLISAVMMNEIVKMLQGGKYASSYKLAEWVK